MILDITGSLNVTIYRIDGTQISQEAEEVIIKDLNAGELYFNLASKKIVDKHFEDVFIVEFEVTDNTEYEFEIK